MKDIEKHVGHHPGCLSRLLRVVRGLDGQYIVLPRCKVLVLSKKICLDVQDVTVHFSSPLLLFFIHINSNKRSIEKNTHSFHSADPSFTIP